MSERPILFRPDLVRAFADAWNEVYGGAAWDANPFVWRVAFKIAEVRR